MKNQQQIIVNRMLDRPPSIVGLPAGVVSAVLPPLGLSVLAWGVFRIPLKPLMIFNFWWFFTFWIASNGGNSYQLIAPFIRLNYRPWYRDFRLYKRLLK